MEYGLYYSFPNVKIEENVIEKLKESEKIYCSPNEVESNCSVD